MIKLNEKIGKRKNRSLVVRASSGQANLSKTEPVQAESRSTDLKKIYINGHTITINLTKVVVNKVLKRTRSRFLDSLNPVSEAFVKSRQHLSYLLSKRIFI